MTSSPDKDSTAAPMHCSCAEQPAPDLARLDAILERHAADTGALIAVLQETQHEYGYLPREALTHIATRRGESLSSVFGVATFYTQFHLSPRGRTIIRICTGTACHVSGAAEVTRAIVDELNTQVGSTSEDLRFTIEAVACVGCCGLAPVTVVNDQTHGKLDSAKARKLAKQLMRTAE